MEEIKNTEAEVLSEELCEETGNNPTVETAEQTEAPAPAEEQAAAEENPMGRNATPADVVPAMAFLLSDEARFITGITLPVTGGSAIV